MNMFRNVLERGGLFDLSWRGDKFTWSNKHDNETFTKERLDKVVANLRWKEIYKEGWLEVLTARCSDHRPLLLSMNQVLSIVWRRRRMFRDEARWSLEEGCEEVIKNAWTMRQVGGDSAKTLQKLLEDNKGAFVKWNKRLENNKGKILKEKIELLKNLQMNEGSHNMVEIKKLQNEIGVYLEMEDLKWRQRAKLDWYQLGDRNTKFFHSCADQRRKKNWIRQIHDEQDKMQTEPEMIDKVFNEYFQKLFKSTTPSDGDIEAYL
ncbi:hypothetical protein F2P56_035635 [Juglans regia]|uniref:Uncharacterized protein LOC108990661 n=2 Tax=Juglans regia TaxID=51240 RepID=A0A2I4ELF6_JUGRE|nr:uncharacterized protein LOC108990661 [Juglans regia]KAF5443040.1 hypothetical protein F2P56_035635 [Juglans regia]